MVRTKPLRRSWRPEKSNKSIDKQNVNNFYRFVYERQLVWYNRFILKLPQDQWTKNIILRKYKYTNVYRELDRGTIWLLDNIFGEYREEKPSQDVLEDIVWKVCAYRLLNRIETFEQVPLLDYKAYADTGIRAGLYDDLGALIDEGIKIWTDAHITLQTNFKQTRLSNYENMLDDIHPNIPDITNVFFSCNDIKKAFERIFQEYGFGPFTSYEVVSDMAYLPYSGLDPDEWANSGPGCRLGIKILFPNAAGASVFLDKMFYLRNNQLFYYKELGLPMHEILYDGKWLNLRNIEHSLCEFGKYYKQAIGVGKSRTRFVPKTLI